MSIHFFNLHNTATSMSRVIYPHAWTPKLAILFLGIMLIAGCSTVERRLSQIDQLPADDTQVLSINLKDTQHPSSLVTLPTRPGVELTTLVIRPYEPIGNVILFAGGHGNLWLDAPEQTLDIGWGKNNFLVRSADIFASLGFTVVVIDTPSDHVYMFDGFRNSAEHVKDLEAVIAYMRQQNDNPVWLVGTSRGTESAAFVALYSREKIDGLVLTSSMTIFNYRGRTVTSLPLRKITVPTLIVAHKHDGCYWTPPRGAEWIKQKMSNARHVELRYFEGGLTPQAGPCRGLSEHGFYGIENEVVGSIAKFINEH